MNLNLTVGGKVLTILTPSHNLITSGTESHLELPDQPIQVAFTFENPSVVQKHSSMVSFYHNHK